MSKMANLQNALKSSSGKNEPPPSPAKAEKPVAQSSRQPNRAEQVNMSAWLHRDFKKSLRLIQARKIENASLQDLMAEALNDLFVKYDVPTVNQD